MKRQDEDRVVVLLAALRGLTRRQSLEDEKEYVRVEQQIKRIVQGSE